MRILVDDIESVVLSMREDVDSPPYYMYGHILEINNRLKTEKNYSKQKYPLIALILDTPEQIGKGLPNYNLRVLIVDYTSKVNTSEQRYAKTFKPILLPLYEKFLKALRVSGLFMWSGEQTYPSHIKIDRPFYGREAIDKGNTSYVLDDPLDAIELINLKLTSTNKIC